MLRVYLSLFPPPPSPVLLFSPWKKEPPPRYPRSRATLLRLQCAARLCVLKSSSGPSLADREGLGDSRVNPKAAPPSGKKIKVATRTAHPSLLGRRVNATLCTPHGSPTLMSAQDDATGAPGIAFLTTYKPLGCPLPRHRWIKASCE